MMQTQDKTLTEWQRLRVRAAAGLPIAFTPDDIRLIAKLGEGTENLLALHDQTKRKILVWQVVAVLQSAMIVGLVQFL